MTSVVDERLSRVAQLLNDGIRFCEHAPVAYSEGGALNVCGLCADGVGLMCFACWGRHFAGQHGGGDDLRCDYCLGQAVTMKQFDATHPAVRLSTPGAVEPTVLTPFVTFSVFAVPMVCGRDECRQRMTADCAATPQQYDTGNDTPSAAD